MTSSSQKLLLGTAIVLVLGYIGFVVYRAGGPAAYLQSIRSTTPSRIALTPRPSVSPSPASSTAPKVVRTPAPTASQASPSATPSTVADAVLVSMNGRRAAAGVQTLTASTTLQHIAQLHASDMAAKGYFSHTDPDGVTFQQRIAAGGYVGTAEAENLGLTSAPAVTVVDDWMGSTDHRINMLNGQYVATGIGVAVGPWQGMQVTFVVAVFGDKK